MRAWMAFADLQRVGIGREEYADADNRQAVVGGVEVVVLRAELDARHIAQADHAAVGLGAQHDVAELLGLLQTARAR